MKVRIAVGMALCGILARDGRLLDDYFAVALRAW